ncbi:hypothetical protein [Streptomyces pacificus]|uniref:Uncharacterized protein n=1 Tax=Streptomyces pacificus TaxID=2705029 RepID=A0A6A0B004_9ACTN|nr:hypothetical protein [Streptomyces pacificus]GFH37921.1 hypothetical protein SCWH03_41610 [Streptomyces pacificus]
MRLSRDITGWAFMVEVDGVRHAALAVGLAGISPFTAGDGAGGSLFTRANGWWGLPVLLSLNELPLGHPVDHKWCVTQDDGGVLSVLSPDGASFVHDLRLEGPPGWRETAIASGSVMLVVSHVLPAMDDPIGALDFETRQGMVCAGPVRFGEPGYEPRDEENGPPTVRFLIDPVGTLMELAHFACERILSLSQAKQQARELEQTRRALAEHADQALSAEAMVELLFRDEFLDHRGLVELMYVYWRLVAEVADSCGAEAAWRDAALRTVESAVHLVADRCDRAVFEEADAVVSRLIDRLSDPAELEAGLLAAARLRMATRGAEDFAADHYARGMRTVWSARLEADMYRTWFTDEEPFHAESHRLLVEAGDLVVRALELDGGTRKPRLWASLAQILADEEGVHRDAAGAAGVALSTPDGRARPVARLIDPGERTRPVVGSGMGVSFTVKAGLLDVGVEKPPGAGPERDEWIVRGHGASQPNPQWEFRQVKGLPLVGDHPVAALVELVPDRPNTAEVLVAAELEHRSWGIRRYRARLAPSPHAIVLAG